MARIRKNDVKYTGGFFGLKYKIQKVAAPSTFIEEHYKDRFYLFGYLGINAHIIRKQYDLFMEEYSLGGRQ